MGRRCHWRQGSSITTRLALDANDRLALKTSAEYLERLLSQYILLDHETLKMLDWILKEEDIRQIIQFLVGQLKGRISGSLKALCQEALEEEEDYCDILARLLKKTPKALLLKTRDFILELLRKKKEELSPEGGSEIKKNLAALKKMFSLDAEETKFCLFLFLVSAYNSPEEFFISHLECHNLTGFKYLTVILDMTPRKIRNLMTGTLKKIGLFDLDRHNWRLEDDYLAFFQTPSERLLAKNFYSRISEKPIPLAYHLIDQKQTDYLMRLLRKKTKSSTHILLYGQPGTGKSSFAAGLAAALKLPAYRIVRDKENTTEKRRAAIMACLNMTNRGEGSLIVVDEADNLLNTRFSWLMRGETQDKGWLNQLLEEPGAGMIWITNSIEAIEDSVLRRFAFSLQFKPFNQRQRIRLWESILETHKAGSLLDEAAIADLSKRYKVSAGAISLAVKKALESKSASRTSFKQVMAMTLEAHQTLMNHGERRINKNQIEEHYSLEGLNMEGDMDSMISRLEAFDRYLRQVDKGGIMNLNLLFYGPPGTGKSELARHIGRLLDRELIVKRASDLFDPYVGMSERHIREAFGEAEREEAVLIVDEADTLLFNRERAVRSWEISFTNEFLTQMERFRGILICTTNRPAGLDEASFRRFNFKVKFDFLTPEGNIIFYRKLLAPLAGDPLPEEAEKVLRMTAFLAPGDFKLVRDRFSFAPQETITPAALVEALREEAELKMGFAGKKVVGF